MTRGLVVGKFYPPHAGHHFLIDQALQRCDELIVVVAASTVESLPLELRARWLRERHPAALVRTTTDDHAIDYHDDAIWQAHVDVFRAAAPEPIDVVFTSEAYGDELARRLGARHMPIDPDRSEVSVSGRALRADLAAHWHFLGAGAREHFAKRVVVLGAESTGTTTLTRTLAEHFDSAFAPEVGWTVSEQKVAAGTFGSWRPEEFTDIATRQHAAFDDAARNGGPVVFSDTDALATCVWEERYLGSESTETEQIATAHRPDLYLLTSEEGVAFEASPLRDGEHLRTWMTQRFRERLESQPARWIELAGTREARLARAIAEVEALLHCGWALAPTLEERALYSSTK